MDFPRRKSTIEHASSQGGKMQPTTKGGRIATAKLQENQSLRRSEAHAKPMARLCGKPSDFSHLRTQKTLAVPGAVPPFSASRPPGGSGVLDAGSTSNGAADSGGARPTYSRSSKIIASHKRNCEEEIDENKDGTWLRSNLRREERVTNERHIRFTSRTPSSSRSD